ncbi:PQQ-dependent dehydrogenase, methanol/ethanol family [Parahaliea maris]|uniref:PQQ-dependent dehydrogenase, methanol/ethanol family n=1 Tax=Parahaliea maris TaxID=2716870 RepID=A0A5C8ZRI5_9GAMM|nr:PQQ-dependent dehydrogenase, methanol/ethanol family [Parahaliea maris]TXS90339.1 PQQ-dependent dehydrogenase, methanol/ethanol family [Parahaliea maris]
MDNYSSVRILKVASLAPVALSILLTIGACSSKSDSNADAQAPTGDPLLSTRPAPVESSAAEDDAGSWSILGRTSDVTHHSPLTQINTDSVEKLGLAWSAVIPSIDGLVGNPLVKDGVVYQSGALGRVYANDARTGELLWRFDPEIKFEIDDSLAMYWSSRFNRGVALSEEYVFVGTGDCRLFAINRKTGEKAWEVVSCNRKELYGITAAPRVGGDMVFIGNNCIDSGATRGYVDAYSQATGDRLWRFYTVPGKPSDDYEFENEAMRMAAGTWGTNWWEKTGGCGSVWDAITYDSKLNQVYIGTAGPAPWNPESRPADAGDELFTNSIVALDATTGEYIWHYKVVPHDGWNFDATMQMTIAELPIDGETRRVVMQAPKNGFFYVLDAKTGEFISANNFTPVNWASHIDQETGRPVTIPDARYWEQPDGKAVASPGTLGAHNWIAMAYNPTEQLVYIPVIITPTLTWTDPEAQVGGTMFDMYYGLKGDPKWKAGGELVAWDPIKQEERWRVDRIMPWNGGVLSTEGNLVFQGTAQGTFDAFDARTGEQKWSINVPGGVMSAPSTVELDGEQYIFIAVGNNGSTATGNYLAKITSKPTLRGASRLLAFKLGGSAEMPVDETPVMPKPPLPRMSEELAKIGRTKFEQNFCVDCHGLEAESGGGSIKDLRMANAETHEALPGIVIGGLRFRQGMPPNPQLSLDDVKAIQAFILDEAWMAYEAQNADAEESDPNP